MLPNRGGARVRGQGRGGLRGTARASSTSRPRDTTRKVHFTSQDGSTMPPTAPRGRESTAQRAGGVLSRDPRRIHAALSKSFDGKSRSPSPSVQGGQGSYQQRYQVLKTSRETERAQAIADGFLADPDRPRTLAEAITPVGTCQEMCAEYERLERIVQNDVWGPEMDPESLASQSSKSAPDEARMVKKFRRAAAGIDEQLPSDLRPPHILKKTLDYLFGDLLGHSTNLAAVHHFVWDRTRAIRNDFSIQQVSKLNDLRITIDSYERIARFHILSLHQLASPQKPYDKYDSQQEREQLDKTLLSLIQLYDDSRGRLESPNEAEFRAYCIIFQIQNPVPHLEDRVQTWPKHIFRNARVQRALKLYAAACNTLDEQGPLKPRAPHPIAQANWRRFWRIVESNEISYLMACVAEIYFNHIRRIALNSIWQSYRQGQSKKTEDWTVKELGEALGMDDEESIRDFCGNYGFAVEERADGVAFIDLTSVNGKTLPYAVSGSQTQNRSTLVERKRYHRTLPAIINGFSVQAAKESGQMEESSELDMMDQDRPKNDSLFVRESDEEESDNEFRGRDTTAQHSQYTQASFQHTLNPFATSFSSKQATTAPLPPVSVTDSLPASPADWRGVSNTDQTLAMQSPSIEVKVARQPAHASNGDTKTDPDKHGTDVAKPLKAVVSASASSIGANPFLTPTLIPSATHEVISPDLGKKSSMTNNSASTPIFGSVLPSLEVGRIMKPITPFSAHSTPGMGSSTLPATSPQSTGFNVQADSLLQPPKEMDVNVVQPSGSSSSFKWLNPSVIPIPAIASNSSPSSGFSSLPNTSTAPSNHLSSSTNQTAKSLFSPFPTSSMTQANPILQTPNTLGNASLRDDVEHQSPISNASLPKYSAPLPVSSTHPPPKQFNSSQAPQTSIFPPFGLSPSAQLPLSSLSRSPITPVAAPTAQNSSDTDTLTLSAKLQRSGESIAASQAKALEIMSRFAQTLVEEQYGLLEQFIEFTTLPIIRAVKEEVETEKLHAEADTYRYNNIINRYGKRWREVCWNRRLARQGKERRRRLAKEREAKARHSRESSIWSQLDALRDRLGNSPTSTAGSPTPEGHPTVFSQSGPLARTQDRETSRSPPKGRTHSPHTLPSPFIKTDSTPVNTPKSGSFTNGASDKGKFSSSHTSFNSSRLPLGTIVRRNDTTRSTYFKLKAMGLDPSSDTLFHSTATAKGRKRSQSPDFETSPSATKKMLTRDEPKPSQSQEVTHLSGIIGAQPTFTNEDEELFTAVRLAREAMNESVSFYKEEIAKEDLKQPKVVTPPSVLRSSIKISLHNELRHDRKVVISGSTSKQPPLRYRDRVSKFVPRGRYADVFKQQNKDILNRSWPRPRSDSGIAALAYHHVPTTNNDALATSIHDLEEDNASTISGKPQGVQNETINVTKSKVLGHDDLDPQRQSPSRSTYDHINGEHSSAGNETGQIEDTVKHVNVERLAARHVENSGNSNKTDVRRHAQVRNLSNSYGILEDSGEDDQENESDGEDMNGAEDEEESEVEDEDEDDEEDDEEDEVEDEEEDDTTNVQVVHPGQNGIQDSYNDYDDDDDRGDEEDQDDEDDEDEERDDEEEDDDEGEEEEEQQNNSRPFPAQGWGCKGGTSVEDAIEL